MYLELPAARTRYDYAAAVKLRFHIDYFFPDNPVALLRFTDNDEFSLNFTNVQNNAVEFTEKSKLRIWKKNCY